jgi:hypothetical protein
MRIAGAHSESDRMCHQKYRLASCAGHPDNDVRRHLPGVTVALAFRCGISSAACLEHAMEIAVLVAAYATAQEALAIAPNAGRLHRATEVITLPDSVVERRQGPQLA